MVLQLESEISEPGKGFPNRAKHRSAQMKAAGLEKSGLPMLLHLCRNQLLEIARCAD